MHNTIETSIVTVCKKQNGSISFMEKDISYKKKQVKDKTKDSTALSLFAKSITDPLVSWKNISVTKNKQVKEKTKDSTL